MITANAIIDLDAFRHNYQLLKSKCSANQQVIAVIKGDAYGHGSVEVAHALSEADCFAVSRIDEAVELREAGIDKPILLLEGCFCQKDVELASQYQLYTAIHCQEQLDDLIAANITHPLHVWLKVDTGMHRLGVQPQEVAKFVEAITATGKLAADVGFMSHFSNADDLTSPKTTQQIEIFEQATAAYPGPKTLANSAGILFWSDAHYQIARAGIALYGISPRDGEDGKTLGLKPTMTLKTKLIAVRDHAANQPVGYGEIWRSSQQTRLGVVAMGYGDGYPRSAPEGTPVFINGRQVPIVGRVSMDMITVDLGADSVDKVGDDVEFWGNNLPIEIVSQHIGTIPYELIIKLTKRVHKTYLP